MYKSLNRFCDDWKLCIYGTSNLNAELSRLYMNNDRVILSPINQTKMSKKRENDSFKQAVEFSRAH